MIAQLAALDFASMFERMEAPSKTPKAPAPLPVDRWGAERIVRFVLSGQTTWRAALQYEVSESVVDRLMTEYHETGRYRTPQQGKGKTDDKRWIYAGPRAAQNLHALEMAFYEDTEHTHISEVRDRHLRQDGCEPGYSTVGKALRDPSLLDISNKRLTGYAKERDAEQCDLWEQRMRAEYTADQIICIDETYVTRASHAACLPTRPPSCTRFSLTHDPFPRSLARSHNDNKTSNRRYGRAQRGHRARGVVMFHKGLRYSALGVFTLDGMVDCHITLKGYTLKKWRAAFKKHVLPHLGEYPGPRSVLVMDNCPNLHTQHEITLMVQNVGARIEFLEPYDPHHMPIEIAFRTAKDCLRRGHYKGYPRRERLRGVLLSVDRDAARNAFLECNYVLP